MGGFHNCTAHLPRCCLFFACSVLLVDTAAIHAFSRCHFSGSEILLLQGVVGDATTMVAMEYFLFGFDKSSAIKKVFWFCVMMFPPLGPALYCLFVYSHSDVLENAVRSANSLSGNAQ
jgi:hypothetical protein